MPLAYFYVPMPWSGGNRAAASSKLSATCEAISEELVGISLIEIYHWYAHRLKN